MEVLAFDSAEELAHAAAARFAAEAARAIETRGEFSVALSGGSTPRALYERLAEMTFDWTRIAVFWSDERFVLRGDALSNETMARAALLDRVAAPRVHPMLCAGSAEACAAVYADLLPERLDLVLLGIGSDGHTASLFPRSAALDERDRAVVAARGPEPAPERITLTVPYINRARSVWFLVTGADKAEALERALHGEEDPDHTPAQAVLRHAARVTLFADRESLIRE